MDDRFKLSDMGQPLYEYSQVMTEQDLLAFERALSRQYHEIPWYHPVRKWSVGVSVGVVMGLRLWIRDGKGQIKGESR